MSIDQEIAKLKKEVIEKTDSSFRVVKHVDDIGEVLVVYVEKTGNEVVMINKRDYSNRVVLCYSKSGYINIFYPM
jgi:hypothetical protein